MTNTFTLVAADLVRLQIVILRRFRQKTGVISWQFFLRFIAWFCVGLAGSAYARVLHQFPEAFRPLAIVACLLVVALVAIVAMPYVSQVSMRKHMLAPNGAFLSPQTVSLSSDCISVDSIRGKTVLSWFGVLALDEDDTNYYLFIDAMQALILPRAAIAPVVAEFEQYTRHLRTDTV